MIVTSEVAPKITANMQRFDVKIIDKEYLLVFALEGCNFQELNSKNTNRMKTFFNNFFDFENFL